MRSSELALLLRILAVVCALIYSPSVFSQDGARNGEWTSYGGDKGHNKYSPLEQINEKNVADLQIIWQWTSIDETIQQQHPDDPQIARATYFQCTPLMIGGVLYGSTSLGQAFAVDAATGETIWAFNSEAYKTGRPPNLGYISRGVTYWEKGGDRRVYLATSDSYLIALNADTGKLLTGFADGGRADLLDGVPRALRGRGYGHPSGAALCRDVLIVGSSISDGQIRKEAAPGRIVGIDARTGARRWVFNLVPEKGEFGTGTWEDESWTYSGGANVWTSISADEELGYVYLPTSTSTNDFYGGHRLGDNLFAESLVCLNAETGERVWHFQTVHHGLWDYDNPAAPNLIDIVVDGKPIKAVALVTKQGFTFVFDRITGEPVWPIIERPVPQSKVPGERTSLTQPFPSKPLPFEDQGVSIDDLIDFTPELREEAEAILENYNYGPLFTPPQVGTPTILRPGYGGGANWPGAACDPETGILYVPSMLSPSVVVLAKPDPARSNFNYVRGSAPLEGPRGLPLFKPPYARITAIDLNSGEHVWMTVNGGEGPRNHPILSDLDLGPLGSNARAAAMVTKSLLFATEGSGRSGSATGGGDKIRAFDKRTGELLAEVVLPDQPTGVPMTYMVDGRQFVVVAIGSTPAQLVALGLP